MAIERKELNELQAAMRDAAQVLLDTTIVGDEAARIHALAKAVLALDEHMVEGGELPSAWASRRQRCRGFAGRARCRREAGHPDACDPRSQR